MRKNSVKNTRINEEVMRELSNIIRLEVKDPRISPVTSVVSVEVAPDLKTCKAYISVLGDDEAVKKTPEITFISDQSIAYAAKMSKLIDEVNAPLHERED